MSQVKMWPKRSITGFWNAQAVCRKCDRDASQTKITHYCIDAINGGPHLCDECREVKP